MTISNPSTVPVRDFPGVVSSAPVGVGASGAILTANLLIMNRVTIPSAGTLRDVAVFVTVTSGNFIASVYSAAAPRVRLWTSGSVAVGSANTWQIIGDPGLAVSAGQQLYLSVIADNATAAIARVNGGYPAAAYAQLPTRFAPADGAAPKLFSSSSPGSFTAPASVIEGDLTSLAVGYHIIARVS